MIIELSPQQEQRGWQWSLPQQVLDFLGTIRDVHQTQTHSQAIRGNHYHLQRHECLIMQWRSSWQWHYAMLDDRQAHCQSFSGSGCVALLIPPHMAHAFYNTGAQQLSTLGLSNWCYRPDNSDTYAYTLIDAASRL